MLKILSIGKDISFVLRLRFYTCFLFDFRIGVSHIFKTFQNILYVVFTSALLSYFRKLLQNLIILFKIRTALLFYSLRKQKGHSFCAGRGMLPPELSHPPVFFKDMGENSILHFQSPCFNISLKKM